MFAKRPVPGQVKTRLSPPLTREEASDLAQAMLDDTVEKCLECASFETSIAVDPPGEVAWFRARYPQVGEVLAQEGADLGERLARHFERAAAYRPGSTLACVGSDAPQVPVGRIVSAHEALEAGADLVLGPDHGGGYYLVGLRRPRSELFTRVRMSTSETYARTVDLARDFGLRVHLLAADRDVDGPADLELLAREPGHERVLAHTSRVLRRILARKP